MENSCLHQVRLAQGSPLLCSLLDLRAQRGACRDRLGRNFSKTFQIKFKKFKFYTVAQLINNVVLVSGVEQSDSVICIHMSILFQIIFSLGYYRVLSSVPCATQ